MQYDVKLLMHYDYASTVGGGRHQLRVVPLNIPGVQRVIASSLSLSPDPAERSDFIDFFGNAVTAVAFRDAHDAFEARMTARVFVSRPEPGFDVSPTPAGLQDELGRFWTLDRWSPHHFTAASQHANLCAGISAYARESMASAQSTIGIATDLCRRIHRDFDYDGDATTVMTTAQEAFALRRGVCQDFSHIMIAGLRGIGIPAGYVSGFLRTIPPPGRPRLEGADAMHAWVMAWCGREAGWQEFDPTNGIRAGNDHITVGYGRDYSDVAPIVGILKMTGGQAGDQSVDVVPVD